MATRLASRTHPAPRNRERRGILTITARIATAIGVLTGSAALAVFSVAEFRARARYTIREHRITVPTDSASIDRGERLAQVRFCAECHGAGLAGRVMADEAAIGRIVPSNLTNGRLPHPLTDLEWERAVRHGVRDDGRALRIMPAHEFSAITDEDLAAIVAYARSLPAAPAQTPATTVGPLLKVLDVAGQLTVYPAALIDHDAAHMKSLQAEPTAAYGKYLTSTCSGCHGPGMSGGKVPGTPPDFPPAANITPTGIGHYTLADLTRLLRTGVRPDGSHVNDGMPWKFTRSLNDVEIAAIYAYLRTVPPREYGHR